MRPRSDVFSTLTLAALIWLFLSPWVIKPFIFMYAVNAWMVGSVAFVIVMAAMRPPRPALASILVALMGVWMGVSPWVLTYTGKFGPTLNAWIFGGAIAVFSLAAAAMELGGGGGRRRRAAA